MECKGCHYYIYSKTLGSCDVPVYHCRFGFSPYKGYLNTFIPPMPYSCREEARVIASTLEPKQLNLFD